jgi:hypothetical protein
MRFWRGQSGEKDPSYTPDSGVLRRITKNEVKRSKKEREGMKMRVTAGLLGSARRKIFLRSATNSTRKRG